MIHCGAHDFRETSMQYKKITCALPLPEIIHPSEAYKNHGLFYIRLIPFIFKYGSHRLLILLSLLERESSSPIHCFNASKW
jgi:hypothetical protein